MNIIDLRPTEPLPLYHSWPLFDMDARFDLGQLFDPVDQAFGRASTQAAGQWRCDLVDDRLEWSAEVYDLFGLPRGAAVTRAETLAIYCEESRAVVDRLRSYAIRHRRGFTVDVVLHPAGGTRRRMRLIGAPVCIGGRPVSLRGVKLPLD